MKHQSRLAPGMLLEGRYRIERKIGEGGMSCVYLAGDLKLPGKKWAVKETVTSPAHQTELEAEAALLVRLSHPRLPRIADFTGPDESGYSYMIMDYIQGMTLDKYLYACRGNPGPEFIITLAGQLLEVLGYLHAHSPPVVFRDLKPANIMLTPDSEAMLIDFGIARSYKQDQDEDTVRLGTVGFAAPEQYGGGQTDGRSDLYALGALLLYLCTGGRFSAWTSEVESHFRRDTTAGMMPVIRRLLRYKPEERYQSADEVREALDGIGSDRSASFLSRRKQTAGGTLVTAVLGTASGLGTTHSCIMMAHFLARRYDRVAVIEMEERSSAFMRMQEIAEGNKQLSHRRFKINGIDFWRQSGRGEVISLLAGSYDAVVLDLGCCRDGGRLEEFHRAQVQVIIASGAEWRQHETDAVMTLLAGHDRQGRVFALPLAAPGIAEKRSRTLGCRVVALPQVSDPFITEEMAEKAMLSIYDGYVPERAHKRRLGLLTGQWFARRGEI